MSSPSVHRTAPPKGSLVQRCKTPVVPHTHTPHASDRPAKQQLSPNMQKGFKVPRLHLMACANHEARRLPLWFFHFFCVGGSAPHIICLPLVHSILPKRGRSTKDCSALLQLLLALRIWNRPSFICHIPLVSLHDFFHDKHQIPSMCSARRLHAHVHALSTNRSQLVAPHMLNSFGHLIGSPNEDRLRTFHHNLRHGCQTKLTSLHKNKVEPTVLAAVRRCSAPKKAKKTKCYQQDANNKVQTWILVSSDILPDISFTILSDISFHILSDISSDILSDIFLTYLLTFFLTYLLTFFLTFLLTWFRTYLLTYLADISSDLSSDILSDISSDILSDISFDILSAISSGISPDILWDISFDILSGTSSDLISDISSDILSDISFWHSFWHIFWHSFWKYFWHISWHSSWHIFWHSFWHIFWHYFWLIFWHSSWHIFWHSFWHIFWHSFWHIFLTCLLTYLLTYLLTFFLTYLLTYLSDISCDISSDIHSDISSVILSDISSDILSDISFAILSDISSGILFDISFWHISWYTVHTKSVSRPRGCRRRNTKTRKRENPKTAKTAETPSTKTGRNENAKTAKTRKRQKRENAQSRKAVFAESKKTLQSIIALAIKDARRWEKHKKTETRKLETGKKCSRFLVVWFCTEAVHSAALWTRRLSQLWAYVKYVPKQSIP